MSSSLIDRTITLKSSEFVARGFFVFGVTSPTIKVTLTFRF